MRSCPKCRTELPDEARFCFQCGAPQPEIADPEDDTKIDWSEDAGPQIGSLFLGALRQRVQTVYQMERYPDFSERLYESGFRDVVDRRSKLVGEKLNDQLNLGAISARKANRLVEQLLQELLDFFIIRHCGDLVELRLPEQVLKYQQLSWGEFDLFQMVLDYLDFAHEDEIVYTDFLIMPVDKLRNAGKSFLFPEKQEKILLICDQSILGSCKEGFALTEKAIYWKAHLQKARQVAYAQISRIAREKDWLNINSYFFNINPTLNFKMLHLLKKIALLQHL
ncbi:MAG: zinc ribbon domain-containing protein [Saprospiraceae bacterium]|nr:zinc ribbon domain-containing protein [Lewinella sp.]